NTGNDNGSTILKKILKSPAPSMRAASNKLCGNPSIKERMIIRLKALINVGRIYTQNDPIRCKSLIRRNVGINPPLKYIVIIKIIGYVFLETGFCCAIAYAIIEVASDILAVSTSFLDTEMNIACMIAAFLHTCA